MAAIIQNSFLPLQQPTTTPIGHTPEQGRTFIQAILNNSPLFKQEKVFRPNSHPHIVSLQLFYDSLSSLQALVDLSFDLNRRAVLVETGVLRGGGWVRMGSKGKISAMCRLIQKYNLHLLQFNLAFRIDPNNGLLRLTNPTIYFPKGFNNDHLLSIQQLANKNFQLIKQQFLFLLECASQRFQWQIYKKDGRYLERLQMNMMEVIGIRELIAVSAVRFEHSHNDAQGRYQMSKDLINFLSHRQSMVNRTLRQQFIGQELTLFSLFLQPFYFSKTPLQLDRMQSQFTRQFQPFFQKFQIRKMANGDNPYLFNTILIKNQHKVELIPTNCQGGFSKVSVAEVQIAYTDSVSPVLDNRQGGCQADRKKWSDEFEPGLVKKPVVYLPKVIAVKMNKSEGDYEKIKHEKSIVQHFRTTTSPFILKYYNCTQKRFKYRQYLLMDYQGPTPSLADYAHLHRPSFSLQSKMHIFIHLANALNYLEKQQVVHMDLSSHNVMVCKDLLIKVIDFGQAYHPFLDSQKNSKYAPGHTLPYCPPETFNKVKRFTSKSDVFSLGVILHRILFNDFPFFPTGELKEGYMERKYLCRWMWAGERVEDWGFEGQMQLLMLLVGRCLDVEESRRPTPYWLFVILNKIFLTLK